MKVRVSCETCGLAVEVMDWTRFQLTVEPALPMEHMDRIRALLIKLGYKIITSDRALNDTECSVTFKKGGDVE